MSRPLCQYYLQGRCKKGYQCDFLHSRNENRRYQDDYEYRLSDPASPNRVWVNPASRYDQDRYQSNDFSQQYRDSYHDNRQYRDSYHDNRQYRDSYHDNHQYRDSYHDSQNRGQHYKGGYESGHSRQQQKDNRSSSAKTGSSFSFTKALDSVQSSNSAAGQSSLQQRVKLTGPSSTSTNFSFVKTLQESNRNVPRAASGDSDFYSKPEDLTEQQKTQFQSSEFSWGKIPLLPPSANYC